MPTPEPPRERSAPAEKARQGAISGHILLVLTSSLVLGVIAALVLYAWYYGFSAKPPVP